MAKLVAHGTCTLAASLGLTRANPKLIHPSCAAQVRWPPRRRRTCWRDGDAVTGLQVRCLPPAWRDRRGPTQLLGLPEPPPSLFPPFTLAQELIGEPGTRIRVGTLDGAGACAGRAGCWEPLAPGSSFCWGPELQGSTSPSSSWSTTPRRAGQDQRKVRRSRAPAPPCAPQPPRPPNARIPHLPATLHRPRAALHTSLPPHPLLPLCVRRRSILPFYLDQGRGRRAEAARRRRRGPCAGREAAWVPRGGEGAGGARRRHLQGGQRWARKGHRTPVVSSFKHCDLFF